MPDSTLTHAEFLRDFFVRRISFQRANLAHFVSIQFGFPVLFASWMPTLIAFAGTETVLGRRYPFQIFKAVISSIPIFVIHLWQIFWIWNESFCYGTVNKNSRASSFNEKICSWIAYAIQLVSRISNSTYSAKVRDFIVGTLSKLSPFFFHASPPKILATITNTPKGVNRRG